jgi:pre-mRNA-processing factor 40
MYELERREREMQRERNYASRADPRDRGKNAMLDYGDEDAVGSRPGSVRKRRESDASMSSRRDNKVSSISITIPSMQHNPSRDQNIS